MAFRNGKLFLLTTVVFFYDIEHDGGSYFFYQIHLCIKIPFLFICDLQSQRWTILNNRTHFFIEIGYKQLVI